MNRSNWMEAPGQLSLGKEQSSQTFVAHEASKADWNQFQSLNQPRRLLTGDETPLGKLDCF